MESVWGVAGSISGVGAFIALVLLLGICVKKAGNGRKNENYKKSTSTKRGDSQLSSSKGDDKDVAPSLLRQSSRRGSLSLEDGEVDSSTPLQGLTSAQRAFSKVCISYKIIAGEYIFSEGAKMSRERAERSGQDASC